MTTSLEQSAARLDRSAARSLASHIGTLRSGGAEHISELSLQAAAAEHRVDEWLHAKCASGRDAPEFDVMVGLLFEAERESDASAAFSARPTSHAPAAEMRGPTFKEKVQRWIHIVARRRSALFETRAQWKSGLFLTLHMLLATPGSRSWGLSLLQFPELASWQPDDVTVFVQVVAAIVK